MWVRDRCVRPGTGTRLMGPPTEDRMAPRIPRPTSPLILPSCTSRPPPLFCGTPVWWEPGEPIRVFERQWSLQLQRAAPCHLQAPSTVKQNSTTPGADPTVRSRGAGRGGGTRGIQSEEYMLVRSEGVFETDPEKGDQVTRGIQLKGDQVGGRSILTCRDSFRRGSVQRIQPERESK